MHGITLCPAQKQTVTKKNENSIHIKHLEIFSYRISKKPNRPTCFICIFPVKHTIPQKQKREVNSKIDSLNRKYMNKRSIDVDTSRDLL